MSTLFPVWLFIVAGKTDTAMRIAADGKIDSTKTIIAPTFRFQVPTIVVLLCFVFY